MKSGSELSKRRVLEGQVNDDSGGGELRLRLHEEKRETESAGEIRD